MRADRRTPHPRRFRQRGAAALMTLVFLLIVVGMAVVVALKMSGSDVFDTASQQNSVQALFLAESATERAAARLGGGTACASLAPDTGSLGAGTYSVTSAAVVGSNCQIRVSGTVGSATRTADVVLSNAGGGAITAGPSMTPYADTATPLPASPPTVSYTVPAGSSILLVGISLSDANATVNPVLYGGTNMTRGPSFARAAPWPLVQIWYLVNPPAGTANVVATVSPYGTEVVMGAQSFTGVNTGTGATAPFDVAAVTNSASSKIASVSITPATSGAWIFEVVAIDANDNTTCIGATAACIPLANQTQRWLTNSHGNVRGAASTVGPISPAASRTPAWNWSNNAKWSQVAVALRPGGGSPKVVQWTEVVQ